jgi:hypothetical protein
MGKFETKVLSGITRDHMEFLSSIYEYKQNSIIRESAQYLFLKMKKAKSFQSLGIKDKIPYHSTV